MRLSIIRSSAGHHTIRCLSPYRLVLKNIFVSFIVALLFAYCRDTGCLIGQQQRIVV